MTADRARADSPRRHGLNHAGLAFGGLLLVGALAAALTVLSGGRPVLLVVPAAVLAMTIVLAPLVGLVLTIVTQIIWLFGAYAPGDIGALAMSKVFTGLTLLAWLQQALRDRIAPTYAPHMVALGGFVLVVLLDPWLTPAFEDSLVGWGKYAMMVLTYLVVANLAISARGVRTAVAAVLAAATLAALLALVERFMPGVKLSFGGEISLGAIADDVSLGDVSIKRVTGGIGDANWFSYTMATTLPLCWYWYRTAHAWPGKCAALAMAALQLVGIVLSYTRTPLIGLAGVVVFMVVKRRLRLLWVVAGLAVLVAAAPLWVPAGFVDRIFSTKYLREGSTPMRREIWAMAIQLIGQRPLLGWGYEQFGPQFIAQSTTEMGAEWARRDEDGSEPARLLRAHNLYLDVWVQHGLVALLPLLLMFYLLLREMNQVQATGPPPEADLAVALMACLISFYLCGLGGHSQELKIFWVLAGLCAGLRRFVFGGDLPRR